MMELMKKTLKKHGIDSFTAKHDIKYGSSLTETIQEAIGDSNVLIAMITKDHPSLSVAQEVGFALNSGIPVIPFVEENANAGFMLGDIAQIRFTKSQIEQACEKTSRFISEEIEEDDKTEYIEKLVDERKLIQDYEVYGDNFEKDNYISGELTSDIPVNLYILDNKNLERFEENEEFDYEFGAEDVTRLAVHFEVPKTRFWNVIIENPNRKDANVDIDLTIESE